MASTRSLALREIMKIEREINKMITSSKFRKMEENLAILNNQSGSALITVEPPEKDGGAEKIRKNSKAATKYLSEYMEIQKEYNKVLIKLNKRREILKKELF